MQATAKPDPVQPSIARLVGYGLPGCHACDVLATALEQLKTNGTHASIQISFERLGTLEAILSTGLAIPSFPFLVLFDGQTVLAAWEGIERGRSAAALSVEIGAMVDRAWHSRCLYR